MYQGPNISPNKQNLKDRMMLYEYTLTSPKINTIETK